MLCPSCHCLYYMSQNRSHFQSQPSAVGCMETTTSALRHFGKGSSVRRPANFFFIPPSPLVICGNHSSAARQAGGRGLLRAWHWCTSNCTIMALVRARHFTSDCVRRQTVRELANGRTCICITPSLYIDIHATCTHGSYAYSIHAMTRQQPCAHRDGQTLVPAHTT